MSLKIVIPSRGRAEDILTLKFFPDAALVVGAREEAEYRKHNPNSEIIVEAPHVNNIVKCRAWLLELFADQDLFMLDDDVKYIRKNYDTGKDMGVSTPKEAMEIVTHVHDLAKQLDAKMFGFQSIRNVVEYNGFSPLSFTGYLNNSYVGFLAGHGLKFSTNMVEGEDYYISLMSKYKNRYHLRESRWTFITYANWTLSQGCSTYRTTEIMKKNTAYLQRMFGSDVVVTKKATHTKGKINEGERSLKFPF